MADQKISQLTNYTTPLTADVIPIVDTANTTTKKVTMTNFFNILSSLFRIKDSSDNTKQVAFNAAGITTGTTRNITIPDADLTLVGLTNAQTITNKTISTGTKIAIASETAGALYYKDASGNLTPFNGTNGQIVSFNSSNIPAAIPNPAAANADTTTKGVVEIATTAEVTAGTSIGGTGAILAVPASAVGAPGASKIVQYDMSGKYPIADGSQITNIIGPSKNGAVSFAGSTQTITHGLGKAPLIIRLSGLGSSIGTGRASVSNGTYSGGSQSSSHIASGSGVSPVTSSSYAIYLDTGNPSNSSTGVIGNITSTSFDIVWTNSGSGATGNEVLGWETQ